MATRFYLRNSTASETKPNVRQSSTTIDAAHWFTSTLGGGQDSATNVYPLDMKTSLGASDTQIGGAITEPGSPHYGHVKLWISPTLSASVTFENTDTFTLVMWAKEGNAAQNMLGRARIYVWKADDTIRAALYSENANGAEASAAGAQVTLYNATALTGGSVACIAGDRIVLELLEYCNNSKSVSYDHLYGFNGASGSAYDSYLEFSKTFEVTGETYSQTVQQGMTVNDRNENPAANVQRLKKKFAMRFGSNTDRPKQGITVTAPTTGWPKMTSSYFRTLVQGLTAVVPEGWPKVTIGGGPVTHAVTIIENAVSGFYGVVDKFVSTRGSRWVRKYTENVRVTGTPGWVQKQVRKLSQELRVTDNFYKRAYLVKKFATGFTIAGSITTRGRWVRQLSQALRVVDTLNKWSYSVRSITQGLRLSASVSAGGRYLASLAQGLTLGAVTKTREAIRRQLSQSITIVGIASATGAAIKKVVVEQAVQITAVYIQFAKAFLTVELEVQEELKKTLHKVLLSCSAIPMVSTVVWVIERLRRWWLCR